MAYGSRHDRHSHDLHCCPWCHCTLLNVNRPAGYYSKGFILRNDYNMLKQKLYAKDASVPRQSAILKKHGVRFSAFDWIPGDLSMSQGSLMSDETIVGVVAFLWTQILFAAHMFPGANGSKHCFENIINSVRWPTHITQLSKNLGENQSLKKVDEWCRLLTVTLIILWAEASKAQGSIMTKIVSCLAPNSTAHKLLNIVPNLLSPLTSSVHFPESLRTLPMPRKPPYC
ncbi:hypothetical protein EV359DRAFT_83519 [Lentinula novae-zelandiae]|nr:hypothetical protein EV359DRAFT_83519 [Lentinula novae-zelandiae]